jgi:hypothetical protein
MDRSLGHVAHVSAARGAAAREMESFGDISEYDVTALQGHSREAPTDTLQVSLEFPQDGARRRRKEF